MSENAIIPEEQSVVEATPETAITQRLPRSFFELTTQQFERIQFLSEMYAQSSFNAGNTRKTKGDYFIIMIKGVELGLSLTAAVEFISVINGKPCIDGKGMLALVRSSPLCKSVEIDSTETRCIVRGERTNGDKYIEEWTLERARQFKVYEKNGMIPLADRTQWKSQPKTMLKWRAVSDFCRALFSDVIGGLYTLEELAADVIVHEDGTMTVKNGVPVTPPQQSALPAGNGASSEQKKQPEAKWNEDKSKMGFLIGKAQKAGYIEQRQGEEALLAILELENWDKFETGNDMWKALVAKCESMKLQAPSVMKAIVEKAVYNGNIVFTTPHGQLIYFKGRTELAKLVGDDFAAEWGIKDWSGTKQKPETYEFAPLELSYTQKPNKHLELSSVRVLPIDGDEAPPPMSDDELDAMFAGATPEPDANDVDAWFADEPANEIL